MPKPWSARRRPVLGQQIVEAGGGMRTDATEDVGEIGERIFAIGHAGRDEGVEVGEVLTSLLVTNEEEILSAEGHDSQRRLTPVVVRRDAGVFEESRQLRPMIEGVSDGTSHRAFRIV
jgi:hypothetical protein